MHHLIFGRLPWNNWYIYAFSYHYKGKETNFRHVITVNSGEKFVAINSSTTQFRLTADNEVSSEYKWILITQSVIVHKRGSKSVGKEMCKKSPPIPLTTTHFHFLNLARFLWCSLVQATLLLHVWKGCWEDHRQVEHMPPHVWSFRSMPIDDCSPFEVHSSLSN